MKQYFLSILWFSLVLSGLAAVLLLGGCGNASESDTAKPSKAEFIKQANAICQETQDKVLGGAAKFSQGTRTPSPAEATVKAKELVTTIVIPAYEEQVNKIRALGAPNGEEAEITAYLEAIENELDKSRTEAFHAIQSTFLHKATELAEELHLAVCDSSLT